LLPRVMGSVEQARAPWSVTPRTRIGKDQLLAVLAVTAAGRRAAMQGRLRAMPMN
jgi:hypothetical protein